MGNTKLPPLAEYFANIEDPRRETKNKKYPPVEAIVTAFPAAMGGADGREAIERYGATRKKWLGKFLALKEGTPKHGVCRRAFCAIRSELLEACFINRVRDIKQNIRREAIAIDGKTVRGMATKSRFKAGTEAKPIHPVSAWATGNRLVFAQVRTEEKSNGITAIPALLEQVATEGRIVTVDAMGCQHGIADKIAGIGVVESTRDAGEGGETERRYFVSGLEADEELFAHAVRAHWGIENRLRCMLDVVYREDACRVRKDHGPRTLALIRKIALTVARSDRESKTGVRGRIQQMAWPEDCLESLLFRSDFASVQEAS